MSEEEFITKFYSCDNEEQFLKDVYHNMNCLQQEIQKLKGVIETYEILIKANNINNWHELKKWLEEIIKQYREKEWFSTAKYLEDVLNKMQELENK